MAHGYRTFLLCLLGSGLLAPAGATDAPPCLGDASCASHPFAPALDGDEALLLLQVNAETQRAASGLTQDPAAKEAAAIAEAAAAAAVAAALVKESAPPADAFSMKKCVAEFIAMTLFVFIGCGSAMSVAKTEGSAWVLQVSLTFGLAITVLAYAIGHYSGGQINCAVTFGLMLHGNVTIVQGIGNIIAQLLGSVLGALILLVMYGPSNQGKSLDQTGGLGTNGISDGWSLLGALIGEIVGTFLLVYVVFETAINPANSGNALLAPLAIGFAVFLAHSVLIPVDGCSINPSRSFGPALVNVVNDQGAALSHLWVFWVGPLLGAAAAAGVYSLMTA